MTSATGAALNRLSYEANWFSEKRRTDETSTFRKGKNTERANQLNLLRLKPTFCRMSLSLIFLTILHLNERKNDPRTYQDNLALNSYRHLKNSGANGIRFHDLCDANAMLYSPARAAGGIFYRWFGLKWTASGKFNIYSRVFK